MPQSDTQKVCPHIDASMNTRRQQMLSSVMKRLNERRNRAGDIGEDAGFTLIELMVVLLILAILLAIAIPTFLGVTGGANDRAAQSNLNTALTNAKSMATQNNQLYLDPNANPAQTAAGQLAQLQTNEPAIKWVSGATNVQGQVSVYFDPAGEGIVLSSPSKNGPTCWYTVDNLQGINPTTGPWGAAAVPAGDATDAPSGAGSFYGHGTPGAAGACNASITPTGASWKTNGF
jgi:type IV pilus assembly protein PilA